MRNTTLTRVTLLFIFLAASVTSAAADALFGDDRSFWSATSETSRRSWRIEDTVSGQIVEVRQFTSSAFSRVSPNESFDIVIGLVGGASQDRAASVAQIDGMGDVKAKAFFHALDRTLLLSAGINAPTGVTALDESQVQALRSVQPTVFGFRQREYGRGIGIDLGAAMGFDVSPGFTVGGGVGALLHGEYDLDANSQFTPGQEITLTGGADLRRPNFTASSDVVYRMFGSDKLGGDEAYQEGSQIELNLRGGIRNGNFGLDASVTNVIKSDNEILLTGAVSPGGDNRIDNGNTLWFSVVPRMQPRPWIAVKGLFDMVTANQSQQQGSSAWAGGFGLGFELQLTEIALLEIRGQKLTGGSEDGDLEFSGWDAAVAIVWQD